jgi:hypothetical protein
MFLSYQQFAGQNYNKQKANKPFEKVTKFKYLGTTPADKN